MAIPSDITPKNTGFWMPAEWEPHDACWVAWPCNLQTWHTIGLARAEESVANMIHAISEFEPVKLLVTPQQLKRAQSLCGVDVETLTLPMNDGWVRDTGPTFLINKERQLAGVDWVHNAWGNNYLDYVLDQKIAGEILKHASAKNFSARFVLEGGSISVDGEGTVLTTKECLLNPNRNPSFTLEEIENNLCEYLGAQKIIWLNKGLYEDETNGHVDEVACFVAPGKVLCMLSQNENDKNYHLLLENFELLKKATDAKGRSLDVVTIQQPDPEYINDWRLSFSYINFYIANGGIVMPSFNQQQYDDAAFTTINDLFPERKVIQIPARDIFTGGGGIHCLTQQQPKCSR